MVSSSGQLHRRLGRLSHIFSNLLGSTIFIRRELSLLSLSCSISRTPPWLFRSILFLQPSAAFLRSTSGAGELSAHRPVPPIAKFRPAKARRRIAALGSTDLLRAVRPRIFLVLGAPLCLPRPIPGLAPGRRTPSFPARLRRLRARRFRAPGFER